MSMLQLGYNLCIMPRKRSSFESEGQQRENTPDEIEQSLYPGKSSIGGFLAIGEKLDDVIARDQATRELYGMTPGQIGGAIEEILQGKRGDEFEVTKKEWRGMQGCQFDNTIQPFSSLDFTITNKKTGASLQGPGLITHLLKEHNFFEGNTRYRVDPEIAIKALFDKELPSADGSAEKSI
jgi:hypothetical protein